MSLRDADCSAVFFIVAVFPNSRKLLKSFIYPNLTPITYCCRFIIAAVFPNSWETYLAAAMAAAPKPQGRILRLMQGHELEQKVCVLNLMRVKFMSHGVS